MTTQTMPQRPAGSQDGGRASIRARTLRKDRWWLSPLFTGGLFAVIVIYLTYIALINRWYFYEPYLSPFYSPCLTANCLGDSWFEKLPSISPVPPSLLIIAFPLGFRFTCYYYRKFYYRAFWFAPPACAVQEPHKRYTGEARFPLILQNVHRYFWYVAVVFAVILTYETVMAFRDHHGNWGHAGFGTLMLLINIILLWGYTLSCHSCRHITGGRLNNFSKHPMRYKYWTFVSKLNARHMEWAWASLVWITLTDVYIRLLAAGVISDPRFF